MGLHKHVNIAKGGNRWRLGYNTGELRSPGGLPKELMLSVEESGVSSVTASAHPTSTSVFLFIDTDTLIGIAEAVVEWKREQEGAKDAADA